MLKCLWNSIWFLWCILAAAVVVFPDLCAGIVVWG